MKALRWVGVKLRKHKGDEEEAEIAVGVAWLAYRLTGAAFFGASVASAALFATSSSTTQRFYHPALPLSTQGAALIARFEGVRLRPYWDGAVACTVGVGHLIHYGGCTASDFRRWTITYAQAMTLLMHDSTSAQACVDRYVTRQITVPQSDALISFTFNVGCGTLAASSVLRDVDTGSSRLVPSALGRYVYAGGIRLQGLATRRAAEGVLYTTGYYGAGIGRYRRPKPAKPVCKAMRLIVGTEWPGRPRAAYIAKHWWCVR